MTSALFNLRERSLVRSSILVLGSLIASFPMSGFPQLHANGLLCIPALLALLGTVDTIRCMRRRWCLYHGGVLFCVYMDLMVLSIIWFFFLYPYLALIAAAR